MSTCSLLLCLAALLTIYCINSGSAGNINCRRLVYHPRCRGVAAKRSELTAMPVVPHRRSANSEDDRKPEEELAEPVQEYIPVDLGSEPLPRRAALWSYLADRSGNILLAHRKLEPDALELNYEYE